MKMTKGSGKLVTLEDGLALINDGMRRVEYEGTTVRISESLRTFRKGCDCVECGARGSHFRLKGDVLKLFVRMPNGNCEQLTSDHIWPKKHGGPEGLWNRQPMCRRCNVRKGHSLDVRTKTFILLHKVRIYFYFRMGLNRRHPYHYERISAKIIQRLVFSR